MTQKELAYIEDAIGHETTIISLIEEASQSLENEDLVSFMETDLEKHKSMKERLLSLLEEKVNE